MMAIMSEAPWALQSAFAVARFRLAVGDVCGIISSAAFHGITAITVGISRSPMKRASTAPPSRRRSPGGSPTRWRNSQETARHTSAASPRYGYDLGCFDGSRLVWQLHYRDRTDRLQIIATVGNPNAELVPSAQFVQFVGKDNHPKKSKNQRYELIPSVDAKRVEGVKFLFTTAKTLFPAISPSQLARQMAAMGYTSFGGVSFDGDNLLAMFEDETYVGRRPYGKRSVARHKRLLTAE